MNKTTLLLLFVLVFVNACKKDKKEDPPPAPIAFYKFDGNTKNSVNNVLNGTAVGSLFSTSDSLGNNISALNFEGNNYVKVPDSDLLDFPGSQYTIMAWIRPSKTSGTYILNKGANTGAGGPWSLDIHPGVVRGFLRTNTDEFFGVNGTTKIEKDVWQHVAASFNGTKLTIYLNGKPEGSIAIDRPLQVSTGDLGIGASIHHFPAAAFEGRLDNIKIFDRGLTDGQVMELYKNYKQ